MERENIEALRTFCTSERQRWRDWLSEKFEKEDEVWFVFPMKETGEKSLSCNDAVEEALCFGWIDSIIKHVDPLHRAQRFSPRNEGSAYSWANIERLIWLERLGLVQGLIHAPYEFPMDILAAIRKDEAAWANYESLPALYKRIRIAYIGAARSVRWSFKSV